jgi:hypothetical protein
MKKHEGLIQPTGPGDVEQHRAGLARDLAILIRRRLRMSPRRSPSPSPTPASEMERHRANRRHRDDGD